jgi:hypothetical protein
MKAFAKLLAAAALGLTAFNATASAQTRDPVIVIAGDDVDRDTIPRGNVNLNRIQRAIAKQLRAGGFSVYDEAVVLPDLPPARTERPLAKLLEGMKLAKTPVDVIVVTRICSSIRPEPKKPGEFRPFISIDASYWRVRDRLFLGNHRVAGGAELPLIDGACAMKPECLLQRVGDSAEGVGTGMGGELAAKLAAADLRGN